MVDFPGRIEPSPLRFAAFISYSHADERHARWLHRRLEAYRIPGDVRPEVGVKRLLGRYLGKVFRDREELAAGGQLAAQIKAALAASGHLIVLCSPRSAASTYVATEIEYFCSLGGADRIIPVIVEADPPACLPPPLRVGPDRLGADLRKDKDGPNAGFVKILAGLLDVESDVLFQRLRRRQRRVVLGLSAAVVVFASVAALAVFQTITANAQRRAAEDALAQLFVQHAANPTVAPSAQVRYALAGAQLFPEHTEAFRLALGATLQDQNRLVQTFESAGALPLFTNDGQSLIFQGSDGRITEWNTRTNVRQKRPLAPKQEIRGMQLTVDQSHLAVAEANGDIYLADRANGQKRWSGKTDVGTIWSIAVSPDGQWIGVAGAAGTAEIRNAHTGAIAFTLKPDRLALYKIVFSASGGLIATASHKGEAQIWSARDGTLLRRLVGHRDRLRDATFLGSTPHLATASMDGTIRIWDGVSGAALHTLEVSSTWVDKLASDRLGKSLISGSTDGMAKVWDVATGSMIASLPKFSGPVYGVAMDPDGKRVAASSADGIALLADTQTGAVISRLRAHEGGPVYNVGFSNDGKLLFTAGAVKALRIWNAHPTDGDNGQVATEGLEHKTVQNKLDHNELFVDDGGTVRVTDIITRREVRILKGHASKVNHVALSRDGSIVATASVDNTARVWRRANGSPIAILRGHIFPVELVALSPDARFVVTASRDETVRLWEVASGRQLLEWPTKIRWMDALGFAADGRTVLAVGEGGSFAWDISRLNWKTADSVAFACGRLLTSSQRQFTTEEKENDPLIRNIWLARRKDNNQEVCTFPLRTER